MNTSGGSSLTRLSGGTSPYNYKEDHRIPGLFAEHLLLEMRRIIADLTEKQHRHKKTRQQKTKKRKRGGKVRGYFYTASLSVKKNEEDHRRLN